MTVETSNFIDGCRNVVWLSGYARRAEDGTVLLAQSDNDARAIPLQIAPPLRCPPANEAFEVKCHIHSEHAEDGSSRVWLEAFYLRRASVRAVPKARSLLNRLRKRAAVAQRPFASREDILAELQEQQGLTPEGVERLLPSARNQGREQFLNRVMLAGFLGNRRFIPPAEGSWDDFGALMFELRQSEDPKRAFRISIPNAGAKFGKVLGRPLWPLAVEARLRVDPITAEDGTLLERRLSLETTVNQIGATSQHHFAGTFPDWWRALTNAGGQTAAPSTPSEPQGTVEAKADAASPALESDADAELDGPVETW